MIIAIILLSVWLLSAIIALLVLLYDTSYWHIADIATVLLFVFMPPIWALGKMVEKIVKKCKEHRRKQKRKELYGEEQDDDKEKVTPS